MTRKWLWQIILSTFISSLCSYLPREFDIIYNLTNISPNSRIEEKRSITCSTISIVVEQIDYTEANCFVVQLNFTVNSIPNHVSHYPFDISVRILVYSKNAPVVTNRSIIGSCCQRFLLPFRSQRFANDSKVAHLGRGENDPMRARSATRRRHQVPRAL